MLEILPVVLVIVEVVDGSNTVGFLNQSRSTQSRDLSVNIKLPGSPRTSSVL